MNQPACPGAGSCGSCCGNCGGCGSTDGSLYLTPEELTLLRQLGETPFLPAGFNARGRHPICLECPGDREAVSDALTGLRQKGLISLDPDIPLQGFDYAAYRDWPRHGSLALTARGQEALELLNLFGAEAE